MRTRNPWVLLRLRLFGWYVRFMMSESGTRGVKTAMVGKGQRAVKLTPGRAYGRMARFVYFDNSCIST